MSLTVLEPLDADMAALMLSRARADRRTVSPRGAGTKTGWCHGAAGDVTMSMRSLAAPIQHYAGDLVATLPAGATLAEVNALLGDAHQWLPLDPAHGDRATIGGIVATNDSGPRRHRFGSPRDLIVGIEVALADGRVVRAGGRVVKNVAGYDLSRLFCGSLGTLGIIASATFKLAPLAKASRTVLAHIGDVARAAQLALAVDALPLTPSAIEIAADPSSCALLVRFETTERSADHMAAEAARFLAASGARIEPLVDEAERQAWARHHDAIWKNAGTVVKVSVLPTEVGPLLTALAGRCATWSAAGRAALGVLHIAIDDDPAAVAATLDALRTQAAGTKGSLTLLQSSPDVRARFSDRPDTSPLAAVGHAVKARFDPDGTLQALA